MNDCSASAAVRARVTCTTWVMFCRSSGSTATPSSQLAPVTHRSCIPERMTTAAFVSALRLSVVLVS
ncbi:hypothetical protein [Modestobacter sp. SYSU DS0511]